LPHRGGHEPNGKVDLFLTDPGFDVELYVTTDQRTMTVIRLGLTTISKERADRLGRKPFARQGYVKLAWPQPFRRREE
jgi:hypothetical protein